MERKDILLFDLDGTITDPKVGITKAVQYALRSFGINVENANDDLCKFIGPPLRQSFKDFYGFDTDKAEKAVEKYREYFLEKGIYENTMYEGMDVMLDKLKKQGKTLIVATSKPTRLAERVLSHFKLDHYFTFVSGAEMNGDRSEKIEIILYAFEKNKINDLERCIMVGDRKHDIIGAKKAGIDSIGVLYGYGGRKELSDAGATHLAGSVAELEKLLCE